MFKLLQEDTEGTEVAMDASAESDGHEHASAESDGSEELGYRGNYMFMSSSYKFMYMFHMHLAT